MSRVNPLPGLGKRESKATIDRRRQAAAFAAQWDKQAERASRKPKTIQEHVNEHHHS